LDRLTGAARVTPAVGRTLRQKGNFMDDEFEKWFASIGDETLNSRSLHANMERAWQMSRIMQHRPAPLALDGLSVPLTVSL